LDHHLNAGSAMRQLLVPICLLLAAAQPALAEKLCMGGPRDQWMSEADVAEHLAKMGYASEFILYVGDGCLEAKLTHEGEIIEIYMEPLTGEVMKIEKD
jgi:hypothetical protein